MKRPVVPIFTGFIGKRDFGRGEAATSFIHGCNPRLVAVMVIQTKKGYLSQK
jgi:hypothetical protein